MQLVVTFWTRLWPDITSAPKTVNESKISPRRMARAGVVKLAARARTTPEARIGICFLVVNLSNDNQPAFEAPAVVGSGLLVPIAED